MKPLTVSGRVEKGEGMATRLGCPTANLAIEEGVVIPGLGVYVGNAEVDGGSYPALICINDGRTGRRLKMEVHLLDESRELVGKRLTARILKKIRDLVPFETEELMTEKIKEDMDIARQWMQTTMKTVTI